MVSAFTGDRGEISARYSYQNGIRTVEIARKLIAGSDLDVQFNDLKKECFGAWPSSTMCKCGTPFPRRLPLEQAAFSNVDRMAPGPFPLPPRKIDKAMLLDVEGGNLLRWLLIELIQ